MVIEKAPEVLEALFNRLLTDYDNVISKNWKPKYIISKLHCEYQMPKNTLYGKVMDRKERPKFTHVGMTRWWFQVWSISFQSNLWQLRLGSF